MAGDPVVATKACCAFGPPSQPAPDATSSCSQKLATCATMKEMQAGVVPGRSID